MAFTFKDASCVVVGTFNIYIVRPDWLAKIGIFQEGSEVTLENDMSQPGFRLSSPKMPAQWIVRPDRLTIQTKHSDEDCGSPMAEVIRALPETPLFALGHNSRYELGKDKFSELPQFASGEREVLPEAGGEIEQKTWHWAIRENSRILNLQLSVTRTAAVLALNTHTDLKGQDSAAGVDAAQTFFEARRRCESLAADILKVEIEHGD